MPKSTFYFKSIFAVALMFFCSQIGWAQVLVSGAVVDASSNEALIGAAIMAKPSGKVAITDIDGNFEMSVEREDRTLEVSYIGYESQTIDINNTNKFTIKLASGKLLDEVLVVGYGTIQKSDKTGAIESIKPKTEDVLQYSSFQGFLQGRAAGVQVLSNGSELNSSSSIRIRGANSLRGDNEPLYVIDGIIVNSSTEDVGDPLSGGSSYLSAQNGLTGINPQDIESIEVLKDASATAIYGSRGANGVILITTKKGSSGETKFNYKATTNVGQVTNLYEVLSTGEYVDYINEFRALKEFKPTFYKYADGSIAEFEESAEYMEANSASIKRYPNVNWADNVYKNSAAQNHRLSVAGGKDESNYYIAIGYANATGNIPGTKNTVGDVLFKYNHKLNRKLTISPRISASYGKTNATKGADNLGSSNASLSRQIVESAPLIGYIDETVNFDEASANEGPNAWISDYRDDATELRSLAAMTVDYEISDVFTYRVLGGIDYRSKERKLWYGNKLFRGKLANGEAGIGNLDRIRWNVDNTLMFKKNYGRSHQLNGTIGVVADQTNIEQSSMAAKDFADQSLRYDGISFGQNFLAPQQFESQESILSFLGRVNYTFKKKYLFTTSFRRDGASKFKQDNRWSFFPSASFAWKLIEEPFFAKSNLVSDAKIRIGYGRTGSQAIKPYQTLSRYTPTANLQSNGNVGGVIAVNPENLGNPDLKWETTDQVNVGLDWGIMDDRFVGSVDLYQKNTSDLLQVLSIGPSSGFETIVTNQGSLQNQGIDIGLTAHVLEGKLKWDVFGTVSFNKNKITNLGVPPAQFGTETYKAIVGANVSGGTIFKVPANIFIEGQPAGLFWGYQTNGIIQNDADLASAPSVQGTSSQLGDILYVDQNGDGNINSADLDIIGDPNPDYSFGLGSDIKFGGFNLNFFFNGVQGQDVANGNKGRQDFATGLSNNIRSEAYFGAWRSGSTVASHPRLGYELQGDFTDRMVEDGSFVRLSFVSLGYKFPKGKIKGIDNLNVFLSGQNLWLLTEYSGYDPEVNSFSFDPTRMGLDWNSFPNQKSFTLGLNIEF